MVKCPICKNSSTIIIQAGVRYDPNSTVMKCQVCDIVFLDPMPGEDELAAYYAGEYRKEYEAPDPHDRFISDLQEARRRVEDILPLVKTEITLLDIGGGSGAFAHSVDPYIGAVAAVEPTVEYRRYIDDILCVPAYSHIGEITYKYDVITMFHLLEHIPNPVKFLREVDSLLEERGRLVIEVPNVDDVLVSTYDIPKYREFYYQKAHLYYYNIDTLEGVLSRAGFHVGYQTWKQRYGLGNHIGWLEDGKPGGRSYSHITPAVDAVYADRLCRDGLADTIWVIATRRT